MHHALLWTTVVLQTTAATNITVNVAIGNKLSSSSSSSSNNREDRLHKRRFIKTATLHSAVQVYTLHTHRSTQMVAYAATWAVGLLAAAASTLVLQHFCKPRLPVYKMSVQGFPVPQFLQGQLATQLEAQIEMHNDNYVPIDVHALWFDMYYMDWDGNLQHIGQVQDKRQKDYMDLQEAEKREKSKQSGKQVSDKKNATSVNATKSKSSLSLWFSRSSAVNANTTSNNNSKSSNNTQGNKDSSSSNKDSSGSSKDRNKKQSSHDMYKLIYKEPIWKISARSDFNASSALFLQTNAGPIASTSPRLFYNFWKGLGHLHIPTTGVAHVKSRKSPITVSIICDNAVNTVTMQVQGLECILHQVVPGWTDLKRSAESVRNHTLGKIQANSTGGILESATKSAGVSLSDITSRVSIEDLWLAMS
jgi:hypothetical protein